MTATVQYGSPQVAYPNEILRTEVGSGLHGIAVAGTDDRDEMGVYIEPASMVLGLQSWDYTGKTMGESEGSGMPHFTWRTQPEGRRSGPGDIDRTLYSLRRYLGLAVKGNPTILLPLFAPEQAVMIETGLGAELRAMRGEFLSQAAARRFLGYMHGQHERMLGRGRQSAVPNRPELVERYGFDVKYASHALRLAYQAREIITTATLTLPMAGGERDRVLAVKQGHVPRAEVSAEIGHLERTLSAALDAGDTPLPARAGLHRISEWSVSAHIRHWART